MAKLFSVKKVVVTFLLAISAPGPEDKTLGGRSQTYHPATLNMSIGRVQFEILETVLRENLVIQTVDQARNTLVLHTDQARDVQTTPLRRTRDVLTKPLHQTRDVLTKPLHQTRDVLSESIDLSRDIEIAVQDLEKDSMAIIGYNITIKVLNSPAQRSQHSTLQEMLERVYLGQRESSYFEGSNLNSIHLDVNNHIVLSLSKITQGENGDTEAVLRRLFGNISNRIPGSVLHTQVFYKDGVEGHRNRVYPQTFSVTLIQPRESGKDSRTDSIGPDIQSSSFETRVFLQCHFTSVFYHSVPQLSHPSPRSDTPRDVTQLSAVVPDNQEPLKESKQTALKLIYKRSSPTPFWTKLFMFDQISSNDPVHENAYLNPFILNPYVQNILLFVIVFMTIVFRLISYRRKKVKKDDNVFHIKLLTKSFFLKWNWQDWRSDLSTVNSKESSLTQLNELSDYIFRPWLMKTHPGNRVSCPTSQPLVCCSSNSKLCCTCKQQLEEFYCLANNHRHVQVAPSFLPTTRTPLSHVGYRLATLGALPSSFPVSKVKIADAGFYYQGQEDELTCYRCGIKRSGWREGDDPMEIHRGLKPTCQHVVEADQQRSSIASQPPSNNPNTSGNTSASDNSQAAGNARAQEVSPSAARSGNASSDTRPTSESGARSSTPTSNQSRVSPSPSTQASAGRGNEAAARAEERRLFPTPKLDLNFAVYPMFADIITRRESFTSWDESNAPPLEEILLNGMHYGGYADCVRCFYCGVGLNSWTANDNIWDEHVRYRPDCGYLLATRGESFIRQTLRRLEIEPSDAQNPDGAQAPERRNDNQQRQESAQGPQPTSMMPPPPPPTTTRNQATAATTAASQPATTSATASTSAAATRSPPPPTPTTSNNATTTAATMAASQPSASAATSATAAAPAATASTGSAPPVAASGGAGEREGQERRGPVEANDPEDLGRLARLQAENRELNDRHRCTVCRSSPINTIFLPCGHLVVCETCAGSLTSCPRCNEIISATARVHFA